ncbi:ferredoxin reductase-like C-terminal NADP-linked domain-containing protein [Lactarius hengduanensis]|nr:ferredoxin reductase-like C-terminal NADP-linked domain-containing protein [Lactarius hengduanensis]
MNRSWSSLRARLASTGTSSSHTSSRVRLSSVVFFASTGVLVSSYLLWPSKYRGSPTFTHKPMSPNYFIPATVSDISQTGPDLAVLTLTLPHDADSTTDGDASSFEPIWSIFVKDDDIQVERPYTPLHGFDENGNIKLWVKRYQRGEVGRWLHSKRTGDTVEIRGPLKTFPFHQGKWDEIVMISGGTGFSPFHQLLFRQLLPLRDKPVDDDTRFTLLHASRSPAELPPSPILQPLIDFAGAHPDHLRVRLFVDSDAQARVSESIARSLHVGRIDKYSIAYALGLSDGRWSWTSWINSLWTKGRSRGGDEDIRKKNILVLVCGPEPMVAAIAGPYGKNYSQGKVGGVLAELGFMAGQVWKL